MTRNRQHPESETTNVPTSAAEQAGVEQDPPGQPDPMGQAKISAAGGQRAGGGDLLAELGALPQVSQLDAIKANAQGGYYRTVPSERLAADLQALQFDDEGAVKVRDALVERARGGAFSGK